LDLCVNIKNKNIDLLRINIRIKRIR
jgi:hypothetical protein